MNNPTYDAVSPLTEEEIQALHAFCREQSQMWGCLEAMDEVHAEQDTCAPFEAPSIEQQLVKDV
jgi:hypothetical protein